MAEIGDYLDCNPEPGTTTTLLGLTKEEIQRQNPYKKVQKTFFKQKFVHKFQFELFLTKFTIYYWSQ